jgi:DUF1365 family protein
MLFIDLSELPDLFDAFPLWSARRPAPARFRRRDYHGDPAVPLDQAVRDTIETHTGLRPGGPIRLLTHLRYFGFIFNPVSFYFIYDREDTHVETILAEITNTPWGERRAIVLDATLDRGSGKVKHYRFNKDFHVSPFMQMDVVYDWRFIDPGSIFIVNMADIDTGQKIFDATLSLQKKALSKYRLLGMLLRYPFLTLIIVLKIHWQALKLWYKGAVFHEHPKQRGAAYTTGAGKPVPADDEHESPKALPS